MGQSDEAVDAIRRLVGTPLKASGVAPRIEVAGSMRAPPPPPPPQMPTGSLAARKSPEEERFEQIMERVRQASEESPPADGHTRVYRYGPVPKDYTPPTTGMIWGKEVPIDEWRKWRQESIIEKGIRDTNPPEAAGRWFTDKADELDYYVKDGPPTFHPAYYADVPSHILPDYNVTKTPFAGSSLNAEREFVIPEEIANAARRFLDR